MNRQNIISAGRMMAIVVMLLGAFHCGATFVQIREGVVAGALQPGMFHLAPLCSILFGALMVVCGLALMVMFSLSERRRALGGPILAVGILTALLGIVAVALVYRNPFSWMTAIVGLAVFIDVLCLRISLSQK